MNLTGTCRKCGAKIELRKNVQHPDATDTWRRWELWRTPFTTLEAEEDTAACDGQWNGHSPMEWCCWAKGSGDPCHKRIRAEDISAKMFACGTHMRKEIEEHERIQKIKERQEAEAEAEEIAKWEGGIYLAAFDSIVAALPDMVFSLSTGSRYDEATGDRKNVAPEKDQYRRNRPPVRKYIEVDMLALQDALAALLERTKRELQAE